MDVSAFIRTT